LKVSAVLAKANCCDRQTASFPKTTKVAGAPPVAEPGEERSPRAEVALRVSEPAPGD
jgi:hypothetical protein